MLDKGRAEQEVVLASSIGHASAEKPHSESTKYYVRLHLGMALETLEFLATSSPYPLFMHSFPSEQPRAAMAGRMTVTVTCVLRRTTRKSFFQKPDLGSVSLGYCTLRNLSLLPSQFPEALFVDYWGPNSTARPACDPCVRTYQRVR
jgi:hypothetical protein